MKRFVCLSVSSVLLMGILVAAAGAGEADGRFDIYWIDTEGGAATLMVTPRDECILVDTGNPGNRDPQRIARVVTQMAKLKAIDHLIVTHYHRDHFGGAEILSSLLPIHNLYDNGIFDGMPDHPGKAYFELKCGKRHVIQPGDVLPLKAARETAAQKTPWKLQCLATRKTFIDPGAVGATENPVAEELLKEKDRDGSDNANSVVVLLSFGPFRFFDAGDLTWNQERRLVYPKNLVGEVDVYQVTHHGLDSSNNPIVLESLKPRVAIMNNGHRKGCTPQVFANLKAAKSLKAIFQVHKNLRPDGQVNNVADAFIANHQPAEQCQGHLIKLSVAPDGKSYSVSIPHSKQQQTFKTKAG